MEGLQLGLEMSKLQCPFVPSCSIKTKLRCIKYIPNIAFLCKEMQERERLCEGEWDTRQSFSKDVVCDTKGGRECLSYTNIPEIAGKL